MMRRWLYIFDEAFRTVRRHKGLTSISVIIMSLSLLMLAVFLLATDNVLRLVGQAQDEMKMYVYLDDSNSQDEIERLHGLILSQDEVSTVTFVSREEALADFRDQLGPDADMLSALRTNPLPNSFWVTPRNDYKNRDAMVKLAARIEEMKGVDEVRYGREFLDKFASILAGIYTVDVVVGFIVILSAVFIIANAVRLTVISRRKTIEILKLVGATNPFIVAPFIIEGAVQGGFAAILSLLLLRVITEISSNIISDITFFSLEKSLIFAATCVVIGAIGSFMALRRYLEMR
ncbi:MAG: ABC transporter permease [Candidatus Krumholzibacteria bacterium]|nr:ABC transporter permease [Candidatus Krumholzibacteria bacterium]MDH4336722.1 ABC transporter permease [Candidatus Krumholzibacteria bacterium]MDH5271221.1 ABC transporter permease [Candidatus Krumholzibacteria bacterium]